jgi:hypothetical protein
MKEKWTAPGEAGFNPKTLLVAAGVGVNVAALRQLPHTLLLK